jgi:hypothetical protein
MFRIKGFFNGSWLAHSFLRTMLQYKGYMISGCSIPIYTKGCQSRGSICRPDEPDLLSSCKGSTVRCSRREKKPRHTDWSWQGSGWTERVRGGSRSPKSSRNESSTNIEHLLLAFCIKIQQRRNAWKNNIKTRLL